MSEKCCPEKAPKETPCCPPKRTCGEGQAPTELPGFRLCPYVSGWLETPIGGVPVVKRKLEREDIAGRWQMRWGIGRDRYQVTPGLYALGRPDAESPVLVTANYKLTFDIVRRDTEGLDAWLLVLDTRGINVWCAAGKGTFGTDELLRRVKASRLEEVVSHRRLIVPQLGAVGVSAHQVKKACGFEVVYGPVRAGDLPAFVVAGLEATPDMRRVTFTTRERLVLTPVELTALGRKLLWAALLLFLLGGIGSNVFSLNGAATRGGGAILAGFAALLTGAVVTPVLLPWLPGRAFAFKGTVAGLVLAAMALLLYGPAIGFANGFALLLALPALSSFIAMNFTGSSTFTSPSGVEKEMRRAIPLQGLALAAAGISWIAAAF